MSTAPSSSPKRTRGRRSSGGRRPVPVIRTSPPGRAALGWTASIRGLPCTFFLPSRRSEVHMAFGFLARGGLARPPPEQPHQLQDGQSVEASPSLVNDNY